MMYATGNIARKAKNAIESSVSSDQGIVDRCIVRAIEAEFSARLKVVPERGVDSCGGG